MLSPWLMVRSVWPFAVRVAVGGGTVAVTVTVFEALVPSVPRHCMVYEPTRPEVPAPAALGVTEKLPLPLPVYEIVQLPALVEFHARVYKSPGVIVRASWPLAVRVTVGGCNVEGVL